MGKDETDDGNDDDDDDDDDEGLTKSAYIRLQKWNCLSFCNNDYSADEWLHLSTQVNGWLQFRLIKYSNQVNANNP